MSPIHRTSHTSFQPRQRWLTLACLAALAWGLGAGTSSASDPAQAASTPAAPATPAPATPAPVSSDEITSDGGDRQGVSVTIYNDSLALVREQRRVSLSQGANRIALRDVSARIMPQTVGLRSLSGPALTLLEQNFDFDLLSANSLLQKYVGRKVGVVQTLENGQIQRETATVLAFNDNKPVLQYADRIETGLPHRGQLTFESVPAQLRDRPTLSVMLDAPQAGTQTLDLSYLTQGMGWQADYVATLAADENSLDLAGWVTLTNQSGAEYRNAQLQLVAGDVARAQPMLMKAAQMERVAMPAAPAPAMAQEALFEYHLYTLPRPTTIAQNQTKQVALLSAVKVPVAKEYRLQGAGHWYRLAAENRSPEMGDKRKVDVFVEFENKDGDLGVPLPEGVVRVYKSDSQQRAQFIGEDRIEHTAKNERVRLKLGSAFDLNGTWKNTAVEKIGDRLYEMSFHIELRNAKEVPATIKVVEPIPSDWKMVKESLPHTKPAANLAQWEVPVPAQGKADLHYTVRIQY